MRSVRLKSSAATHCIDASCSVCTIDETRARDFHVFSLRILRSVLSAEIGVCQCRVGGGSNHTSICISKCTLVTTYRACNLMFESQQPNSAKVCIHGWYVQGSPARYAVGKAVPLTAHERLPHDGSIVDPPAYLYHPHPACPSRIQYPRYISFFQARRSAGCLFEALCLGRYMKKLYANCDIGPRLCCADRINLHVALSRGKARKVEPRASGSRTPAGSDREARLMLCAPEYPDIPTPIAAVFECNVGA